MAHLCITGIAQNNLVPNPSFESYNTLQCDWVSSYQEFNAIIQDWTVPTYGTSDIFNELLPASCAMNPYTTIFYAAGPQQPRTGNNMAGIYTFNDYQIGNPNAYDGYREYLQVPLSAPLEVGQYYHVEFWVSRAEGRYYASNNIGAYFSDTMVNNYIMNNAANFGPLFFTPHILDTNIIIDSINWTRISGCYQATSTAEYLIIGNFHGNSTTDYTILNNNAPNNEFRNAYYFVDDVTVSTEPSGFVVSTDDTICPYESIQLFASGGTSYLWDNGDTGSSTVVSPDTTTTYQVEISDGQCTATREVTIHVSEELNPTLDLQETTLSTQSFAAYQWLDCDNNYAAIAGANFQSYTPSNTGNYAVQVTLNGCVDTSACMLVDYTGMEELLNSEKELVKVIDLMGRETTPQKKMVLIYIYSDGTIQRVFEFE